MRLNRERNSHMESTLISTETTIVTRSGIGNTRTNLMLFLVENVLLASITYTREELETLLHMERKRRY